MIRRSQRVEANLSQLREHGAFEGEGLTEDFARAYLRHTATAFAGVSPRDLTAFLENRFEVLEAGKVDTITVEVTNPGDLVSRINDDDGLSDSGPFITRVEVHSKDRPFILSTIQEYFHSRDIKVLRCFHPVLAVTRNSEGSVTSVKDGTDETANESLVFMEVERVGDPDECHRVRNDLRESLAGVRRVTDDFQNILNEVQNAINAAQAPGFETEPYPPSEIVAFLEWLKNQNFVFQGYRHYSFPEGTEGPPRADEESALGVLRLDQGLETMRADLDRELGLHVASRAAARKPVSVLRTDVYSRVHRALPLDYVAVKHYTPEGQVAGERVFIGNFSNRTVTEKVSRIPILRRKTEDTMDVLGLVKNTHYQKRAVYALNSYPKEDLFYSTPDELAGALERLLAAEEIAECQVFINRSQIGARLSLILVLPKFAYTTDLKAKVYSRLVNFFGVEHLREYVCWSEDQTLRLHYYISQPGQVHDDEALEDLREELTRMVRPWRAKLADLMHRTFPGAEGERLAKKYRSIFGEAYQSIYPPETAIVDAYALESLFATGSPQCVIVAATRDAKDASSRTDLRVYTGRPIALNRIVPILANFGLQVLDEDYTNIETPVEGDAFIYSFRVTGPRGGDITDPQDQDRLAQAVSAILNGEFADHALNSLILEADLDYHEVDILVGYRNYYLQLNKDYTPSTVDWSLTSYPELAKLCLKYFAHKFHPDTKKYGSREHRDTVTLPAIATEVKDALAFVEGIAPDKILRNFFNLMTATLRTSYYKKMPRKILSIKVRSEEVWEMPEPRPFIEVYVHGQGVEGIHLRGGPVARGGLRWTDRRDDFRFEVLELMKTQMTKNALIVPVGAKGGFYPKLGNRTGKDRQEEALAQYRFFIRGLLEISDSYGPNGEEIRPKNVFPWDDFDPYLVVAADKGTATFSDVANELSAEYDFWMGDAFASGGSIGYSHKELGITARGAWECVKRHFREMGKDIQREDFTCVGIGDMSGDVFGNGMLLSEHIQLVAAFNHKHIFLDPTPDSASSFLERKRLFEDPKLQWTDYDSSKISKGGGVVNRAAKTIQLSPEIRKALGTQREEVNGEELVNIILKAPVELLWNGGIGTYVKATHENHHEVRDKSNDRVRVDAKELRCKVIGEGGNLGFTQKARLEFMGLGGRMNTDAIDNSGGVDMSDHEVNLKILMDMLQRKGRIPDKASRDQLLRDLTQEVVDLVLKNNYMQSLVISLDSQRSLDSATPFVALTEHLEAEESLNRRLEAVGDDSALLNFQVTGRGIPRGVLAILLAYSKRNVYSRLLDSGLPDEPEVQRYLVEYFPPRIHEQFGEDIFDHRLRREIIATMLANTVVDQAGMTYLQSEVTATGRPLSQVVKSYLLTDEFLSGPELRRQLFELDNTVPAEVQYDALLVLEATIAAINRFLLSWQNFSPLSWENLEERKGCIEVVLEGLADRLPTTLSLGIEAQIKVLADHGVPEALAKKIAYLPYLKHLLGLVRVSEEAELDLLDVAQVFFQVGNDLRFDWLQERATQVTRANDWEVQFLNRLSTELYFLQGEISKAVIRSRQEDEAIDDLLQRFYASRSEPIQVIHRELERLAASGVNNLIPIDLFRDHYREIILAPPADS